MKALNILLVGVLFSFLPSVYADESDLVEQLARQAKPIIERREKHGGRVQELKLQLERLAKDKQASLTNIAVLNKEEPILDKAWELLKMEDYETAPILNKVWEKLEIGEFESDKDFLARKETARVKAQKEFDLVYGEWKSKKATDKRVSDFEKKKALLKEKLTKEYDEAVISWKSKVVTEDKKLEQIEKSSKLATSDLTEEINKLSTLQGVATFTLEYGAKQVSLPKFNREKMAFQLDLSTEITEGKYGLIQSKKAKDLYVKIDELSKHKTKQYEVKFKTLEEAKTFKELFESNKVFLEQKFSLRLANIPSSSPAYFEPAFYKAAVKEPDVYIPGSYTQGTRSTTEVVGTNILIFFAGSILGSDPQRMNEAMQSNNASQTVFSPGRTIPGRTIPAINIPEIKVAGVSYNFAVAECKVAILSSTGEGAVSGEVALVASISNLSGSNDYTQSNNTTGKKQDLTKIAAAIEKEMVLIPAGKFMMGSTESEKGRDKDETQHEVTLTKPFYMGKYEVTQEQWEAVMDKNPSSKTKGSNLPVTDVSWEDCQEFIKKLNASTKGGYRLPYEAEWEYACRAGTTTPYSFGDSLTKIDANIDGSSLKAVGSYKANGFGLYDMHGNVWEWCEDWKADYTRVAVIDPNGPVTGAGRVLRGGAFWNEVSSARSSGRNEFTPDSRHVSPGLRLARTVDLKAEDSIKVPKTDTTKVTPALGKLDFTKAAAAIEKEMVLIPAGKFMMGSPATEKGRSDNETQHEVTLTKSFYMGKYEVTQEQWEAVMGYNPDDTKGSKLPVTDVSWEGCQEFIKKLNAKTNGGYRLPTEAEWEYACRARTTTAYSFGDTITPEDVNNDTPKINKHKDEDGVMVVVKTHKPNSVGAYKPNAFGLYDMHGNVCEWCEDWYGDYPAGAVTDPKGPLKGEKHVVRGGGYSEIIKSREDEFSVDRRFFPGMSSTRFGLDKSVPYVIGLRLVKTK